VKLQEKREKRRQLTPEKSSAEGRGEKLDSYEEVDTTGLQIQQRGRAKREKKKNGQVGANLSVVHEEKWAGQCSVNGGNKT